MNPTIWLVLLDLVVVMVLITRRLDVRLVLLLAALPLFAAKAGTAAMVGKMAAEMSNPATIVPICSAIGFAYVLRTTGCDRELVRLLLSPLRRAPWLLVPGGVLSGYLVNTTIVSQTGAAAVLGPILIPLLRAGGVGAATAGAVLLLGCSLGGELFNPGAVELRKLSELTGLSGHQLVARQAPLNFVACGSALLAFWFLTRRRSPAESARLDEGATAEPIHAIKAMVPTVPLVLLTVDAALGAASPLAAMVGPSKILAAMSIGVALAGAIVPGAIRELASSFFEGAGYAYTHVISLIVAASTFAEGVRESGLIELTVQALGDWPTITVIAATFVPWSLGVVSGSGIAPAVAIMDFFVPAAEGLGLDPVRLGTLAALGAHFGRTMSPAAAVVAMSSRLADERPSELLRRVALPLLFGMVVMIVVSLLGVV
jgi:DcuC family C4-dicarboxylate transporter